MSASPLTFAKYGDSFTRLDYEPGFAALYRRETPSGKVQFEVWKLRTDSEGNEKPPSASQWGTYGWTFLDSQEQLARQKYLSLLEIAPWRALEGIRDSGPVSTSPALSCLASSNLERGQE